MTNPYRICSASLSCPHALEDYFSFDIIADPQPSQCLRRILPAPVGRFRISLRIGDSDDKFMLHQRARFSRVQKLPLIRNAGRTDFIVSDLKPIQIGRHASNHFRSVRFDSDRNIVARDRPTVLNRKPHEFLASRPIVKYTSLTIESAVSLNRTGSVFVLIS